MIYPKSISSRLRAISYLVWMGWSIGTQSAGLPSDNQCRALWDQKYLIKPEIEGWCLLIDRDKGNCLACHGIAIDPWPNELSAPGNAALALIDISKKFQDRTLLKKLIDDASSDNLQTFMPLFGKHQILNEKEIDLITNFLMTL